MNIKYYFMIILGFILFYTLEIEINFLFNILNYFKWNIYDNYIYLIQMQEAKDIIFENKIFERCAVTLKINNILYDAHIWIIYKNNDNNTIDINILKNIDLWQFSNKISTYFLIQKNNFIRSEMVDCYYNNNNNKIDFKLLLLYDENYLIKRYHKIPALSCMNEIEFILKYPFIKEFGKCTNILLTTNEDLMFTYNKLSKLGRAFYLVTTDRKYGQVFYFQDHINYTRQLYYNIENNLLFQYYNKSKLFQYYSIAIIILSNK